MIRWIGRKSARWLDRRLHLAKFVRRAMNHVFPDHWSFMLGEVALYSFIILVLTGIFLSLFYNASDAKIVYHGSYHALDGVTMTAAYKSVLGLSFDVRAGLLVRQMHHWAALIFLCAIVVHLARIFFTAAYRRPREINWVIGLTMFLLALANGYFGYSLAGDLLSGAGLRIAYAIMLSIPFFGKWVPYIVLGGNVPSDAMVPHMYGMHIFVVPTLIGVLVAIHLTIIWRQMHTNLPGPRRSDVTIVGSRLYPSYSAKSIGLFLSVFALVAGLGAFVQIDPIWIYGPYDPMAIMPGAQPDWYLGWIEGAMRLFPGVNIHMGYYLVPELFFPAVLMPVTVFIILYAWPWIDKWMISFDNQEHNVLKRPSQQPFNTAFGCAGIVFMLLLLIAGGDDVIAVATNNSVAIIRTILRGLVCVLPTFTFCCVYLLCRSTKRKLPAGYSELPPENIVDDQRLIQPKGLAGELGD